MTFVDYRYGSQSVPAVYHMSGIYVFTCLPTGKIYVGSAKRLRGRELDHRKQLRDGKHSNYRFQQAWNRYGEDSFAFSILLVCEPKDLLMYEQRALDVLQPTINMLKVAGSSLGRKYSPEAYARIAAAARANAQRPEVRAKMAASARGRTFSPEYREKLRAALKGRPRPAEVIAKIIATKAAKRGNKPLTQQSPRKGLGRHPDWKERLSAFYRNRRERLGLPPAVPYVRKGRKHSAETRAKMSASRKGQPKSAEWHARHAAQSARRKGIPRSPEVIAKMRATIQAKKRMPNSSQGVLAF